MFPPKKQFETKLWCLDHENPVIVSQGSSWRTQIVRASCLGWLLMLLVANAEAIYHDDHHILQCAMTKVTKVDMNWISADRRVCALQSASSTIVFYGSDLHCFVFEKPLSSVHGSPFLATNSCFCYSILHFRVPQHLYHLCFFKETPHEFP